MPRPRSRPTAPAAAFFDVDNTMMMGASLFWFARGLAARKYFTTRDMVGFVWQQAKFRIAGNESSADDIHTMRENALAFVAGRPVAEIVQASEEIYDELMADRIWAGTRRSRSSTSTPASGCGWSRPPRSSWPRSSPTGSG